MATNLSLGFQDASVCSDCPFTCGSSEFDSGIVIVITRRHTASEISRNRLYTHLGYGIKTLAVAARRRRRHSATNCMRIDAALEPPRYIGLTLPATAHGLVEQVGVLSCAAMDGRED